MATPPPSKRKPVVVRVGGSEGRIYQCADGMWAGKVRFAQGGPPKVIRRKDLAKARAEVVRICIAKEQGLAQAARHVTALDAEVLGHARAELAKLGEAAPPLIVAVTEYVAARLTLPAGLGMAEAARIAAAAAPAGRSVRISELVPRLAAALALDNAHPRHLRGIRNDPLAFAAAIGDPPIAEVTPEQVRTYVHGLKVGPRRKNNVRSSLVEVFRLAVSDGYLPAVQTAPEKLQPLKVPKRIAYWSAPQISAILKACPRIGVPWVALIAFGGCRTTEVVGDLENLSRPTLAWEDIDFDAEMIYVPEEVGVKSGRARRIPLKPNLAAWLLPFRGRGPIYPKPLDTEIVTGAIRRAGLTWSVNASRHSYGTHRSREVGASVLADEMGNSLGMIRRHYDAVPRTIDAAAYFGVLPGSELSKIIPLPVA